MDKLPLEVLHNLFIQLPWTLRKQCRLVCRQWTNILRAKELQCNNRFYVKNMQSLSEFLSSFQEKPELALQVEYLTLNSIRDDFDTRTLPGLFPNLKKLTCTHQSRELRHYDYYSSLERPELEGHPRSFGIQHLQDFYHCELTRFLVSNGLCACLETLVLRVSALDNTPNDLFSLLKDMPVLKSLTVESSPIDMEACETIHSNIPSLETLCLSGVDLLSGELPQEIQPALLLTRLDLWTYDQNYEGKTNWLRYIGQKYTNIKHFNYDIDGDSYCREMKNIYSAEFPALLQIIGPQLESLKLNPGLDRGHNAIRTLGALDCRIKNVGLYLMEDMDGFDALAETSLFRCIEDLSLSRVEMDVNLARLKEMSNLKTLKIHFEELDPMDVFAEHETEEIQEFIEDVTIDMNQLFRHLPTPLESVTIGQTFANFERDVEGEIFDIKKLEFHFITPRRGRPDQFISKHFPNLQSLSLLDSIEEDGTIMLPNHHLSHLEVSKCFVDLNVRLVTNDKTRFFSVGKWLNNTQSDFKSKLLPVSESDIQNGPYITITCASVDKLTISGFKACLKSDTSQASVK